MEKSKLRTEEIEKEKLGKFNEEEVKEIIEYLKSGFTKEVELGLKGEITYKDSEIFEAIDCLYRDLDDEECKPHGCYFCDHSIDGNAAPFDFPNVTKLCLTCMLKVANVLVAFGINHNCLFPDMGERKVQKVLYEEINTERFKKPEIMH